MLYISKRNDWQTIRDAFQSKGYNLLSQEYHTNKEKLICEDKEHYKYTVSYNNFCKPNYAMAKFHKSNPFTAQNLQKYLADNNVDLTVVDISERTISVRKDYISFICSCGRQFEATIDQVVLTKRHRCPYCSLLTSIYEQKVEQYLIDKNVNYVKQKTFDDCIANKRRCRFDFYLSDYNTVIEVHGQQHYYENNDFVLSLQEQKARDKYKQKYCEAHNIKYVEIPFWLINEKAYTYMKIIDKILG